MIKRSLFLGAITGFVVLACSPGYKVNSQLSSNAAKYRTFALLPLTIDVPENKLPDNVSFDAAKRMLKEKSYVIQRLFYSYLLEMQWTNKYTVSFQEIDQTTALLSKAGLIDNLEQHTPQQIGNALGVDGILVINILQKVKGTQRVFINAAIYDCISGSMLGEYRADGEGDLMSSPERLPIVKMKEVAKKFPFRK